MPVSPTDSELFNLIDAELDRIEYAKLEAKAAWELFHAPSGRVETFTSLPELSVAVTLAPLSISSRNAIVSWPGYWALLVAIEEQRHDRVRAMIEDLASAGYVKTLVERDAVLARLTPISRDRVTLTGPSRCDEIYPTGVLVTLENGMSVSNVPLEVFERVLAHRANSKTPVESPDATE